MVGYGWFMYAAVTVGNGLEIISVGWAAIRAPGVTPNGGLPKFDTHRRRVRPI